MTAPFDEEAGWVPLFGFLAADEVSSVQRACDDLLLAPVEDRWVGDKPASGTQHLVDLHQRSALVADIVTRPELVAVVTAILVDDWHVDQVGYRNPQPGFGGQQLHADDLPKLDTSSARVATAIITLTPFSGTNGATRVVPGSHRRPDLQRHSGSLAHHPDEITLVGPAGTAFVFSGHLLHSGTPNNSAANRPALQVVWRSLR